MSDRIYELLNRNQQKVFGEGDAARRRAAIEELYTDDCVLYVPPGVFVGHDALDKFAGDLRATHPHFEYTPHGEPQALHNAGRLAWGSGPRGEKPEYTGLDVIIVRGDKIAALYVFLDKSPMPENAPVWRYLSLAAVFATIKTGQLRLTRIDRFRDPFEGSVTKKQMEVQNAILAGGGAHRNMMNAIAAHHPGMSRLTPPDEDPWLRITRWRRARTRSCHASCWSAGEESEALWRLYCADGSPGVGVALQTTLGPLKQSVAAHDLYVGPITYLRYHEAPPFTNDMEPLMHKRHGFAAEQELRILRFDEVHFKKLVPKDASIPELREHIYLEWRLADVIEKIIISPYADESYEGLVRHTISTADASLADRIELSELHERRYAPEF